MTVAMEMGDHVIVAMEMGDHVIVAMEMGDHVTVAMEMGDLLSPTVCSAKELPINSSRDCREFLRV